MKKIVIKGINSLIIGSLLMSGTMHASFPQNEPPKSPTLLDIHLKDAAKTAKTYFDSAWDNVSDAARKLPAMNPRQFVYSKTQSLLNSLYVTGAWALGATALTSALRYSKTARKAITESRYYDHGKNYVNNLRNGDRKTLAYTGAALAAILALYYRKQIASLLAQLAGYSDEAAAVPQDPRIGELQEQLRVAREAEQRLTQELQAARENGASQLITAQETESRLRNELQIVIDDAQGFKDRIAFLHQALNHLKNENKDLVAELDLEVERYAASRRSIYLLEQELEDLGVSRLQPFSETAENNVPFNIRTVPLKELRQIQSEIGKAEKDHPLDSAQVTLIFNRDGYEGRILDCAVAHDDVDPNVTVDESDNDENT